MKHSVFVFICILMAAVLSAQALDKGNFMVGTALGFTTANSKIKTNDVENEGKVAQQINVAPAVGFFLMDNLALGLGADWTLNKVTDDALDEETDDSDLLFGPFARYYFPLGHNSAIFALANFGFGNSQNTLSIAGETEKINTNVFAFGVGPGITVYTPGGFGLEAIFKYNYARSEFDIEQGGVKQTTESRTNQFAISLGFQYYFGGFRRIGG